MFENKAERFIPLRPVVIVACSIGYCNISNRLTEEGGILGPDSIFAVLHHYNINNIYGLSLIVLISPIKSVAYLNMAILYVHGL